MILCEFLCQLGSKRFCAGGRWGSRSDMEQKFFRLCCCNGIFENGGVTGDEIYFCAKEEKGPKIQTSPIPSAPLNNPEPRRESKQAINRHDDDTHYYCIGSYPFLPMLYLRYNRKCPHILINIAHWCTSTKYISTGEPTAETQTRR